MAKDDNDFDVLVDDEYDVVGSDEEEGDTLTVVSSAARSLAVRRAIEQRLEQRRMSQMLDYLEVELEDEE